MLIDRLPTRDGLVKVGVQLHSLLCVLCNRSTENVCYLFFSCSISTQIWNWCDSWFGVQSVHHCRASEHFLSYSLLGGWKKGASWVTVIWSIWKHRNGIIFKNRQCDALEVLHSFRWKLGLWPKSNLRRLGSVTQIGV